MKNNSQMYNDDIGYEAPGLRKTILRSLERINGLEATTVFIFEELKNANNTLHG